MLREPRFLVVIVKKNGQHREFFPLPSAAALLINK